MAESDVEIPMLTEEIKRVAGPCVPLSESHRRNNHPDAWRAELDTLVTAGRSVMRNFPREVAPATRREFEKAMRDGEVNLYYLTFHYRPFPTDEPTPEVM